MFEDVEEVMAEMARTRRRYCGLTRWLETLEESDRERAYELLASEKYNSKHLAVYFNGKGAGLDTQVVNRHRNKICCGQGRD